MRRHPCLSPKHLTRDEKNQTVCIKHASDHTSDQQFYIKNSASDQQFYIRNSASDQKCLQVTTSDQKQLQATRSVCK